MNFRPISISATIVGGNSNHQRNALINKTVARYLQYQAMLQISRCTSLHGAKICQCSIPPFLLQSIVLVKNVNKICRDKNEKSFFYVLQ